MDANDCDHIHLDAVGGIAGDMFVAALLDCFPHLLPRVLADIAAVLPANVGEPALEQGLSAGIRCQRFRLRSSGTRDPQRLGYAHGDGKAHAHGHHHEHACQQEDESASTRDHGTSFAALKHRIESAELAAGTADRAVAILEALAEAEAHIHGVNVEDVHFHEVGDWDSLMDVVAAGSIIAAIGLVRWTISDLPRGSGLVRTAHGLLPVPAPATVRLLEGFGWRDDGMAGERVTPTGAAILRMICSPGGSEVGPVGRLIGSGTGAGTRDFADLPNILRATAFRSIAMGEATPTDIAVVSFDIDDMSGEEIGVAIDRLRSEAGVLDLTIMTAMGKKGRPVSRFELLVRPELLEQAAQACFTQTSTIGLRWRMERRSVLNRLEGHAGGVRVKSADRPGGSVSIKAESDDLSVFPTLEERRRAALKAIGLMSND